MASARAARAPTIERTRAAARASGRASRAQANACTDRRRLAARARRRAARARRAHAARAARARARGRAGAAREPCAHSRAGRGQGAHMQAGGARRAAGRAGGPRAPSKLRTVAARHGAPRRVAAHGAVASSPTGGAHVRRVAWVGAPALGRGGVTHGVQRAAGQPAGRAAAALWLCAFARGRPVSPARLL